MTLPAVQVSVLDLAPVWRDSSPAQSLRDTIELAAKVEALGYLRYWVAEHHNTQSIASSSPPVLAGQIAAATSTIRVGSGGVLLPNHPTLVIAEQFGTLEALYPGRVDLGLGRGAGTDLVTAQVLRHPGSMIQDLGTQIAELEQYFAAPVPRASPPPIIAVPAPGHRPQIWVLGTSPSSAQFAASAGLPYAFAHHIMPQGAAGALRLYRQAFRPSRWLAAPYAIIAASVVVADSDERAGELIMPMRITGLQLRTTGKASPMYTTDEAAGVLDPVQMQLASQDGGRHLAGSPESVNRSLTHLLATTQADELMALTIVHEQDERLRSYQLLAEMIPALPQRQA